MEPKMVIHFYQDENKTIIGLKYNALMMLLLSPIWMKIRL